MAKYDNLLDSGPLPVIHCTEVPRRIQHIILSLVLMLQGRNHRREDDNPTPYTPLPKDINVEPNHKGWLIWKCSGYN